LTQRQNFNTFRGLLERQKGENAAEKKLWKNRQPSYAWEVWSCLFASDNGLFAFSAYFEIFFNGIHHALKQSLQPVLAAILIVEITRRFAFAVEGQ
jgi:hypothetical protein